MWRLVATGKRIKRIITRQTAAIRVHCALVHSRSPRRDFFCWTKPQVRMRTVDPFHTGQRRVTVFLWTCARSYTRSRTVRWKLPLDGHFVQRSKGYRRTDGSTVGFLSQTASCESTIDGVDLRECKVALRWIELNGVLELSIGSMIPVVDRSDIFFICMELIRLFVKRERETIFTR